MKLINDKVSGKEVHNEEIIIFLMKLSVYGGFCSAGSVTVTIINNRALIESLLLHHMD